MARILLGVSGGIAAYKGLELARLATKAGHGVRVVMTPAAQRFVGAASFEGIVGAPVLVGEFDRDPMRGGYPGDAAPEHDPIGHLALAESADVVVVAPASANTIAKLAAGICDSLLTTSFLADRRAADRRPGDERPHVRGRRDPGEPRDAARARRRRHRARRGRARLARRARRRPAARARAPAARDRGRAAVGGRARGTACGSSSAPAAPASRSTRCASSATARAAGWASPSPPPRGAAAPT